jgi:MoCo/4Fe-4S cofactor protein with predicted Tat translocation signal
MSQVTDKYWRSLAELEDTPAFRASIEHEFPEPLEALPPDSPERRRFMQVMAASLALAGVSGCRWKEDKLMPLAQRPEGWVPGEQRHYATAMELGGVGAGLVVTSYEGRPVKVEGNPLHPTSRGAASIYHQASILEFYDPDRSHDVVRFGGARTVSSWAEFEAFATTTSAALKAGGGAGLRVLAGASSSPTLDDLKRRLTTAFPQAKWVEFEPISRDNERLGSTLAFGKPHRTLLAIEQAKVVVSLDGDPIAATHPAGLANARALIEGRVPENGTLSRVYVVESTPSLIGVTADHRLALRSEQIKAFAAALDAELGAAARPLPELGAPQPKPSAAFLADAKVAKLLAAMVKDLAANVGKSAVIAGSHQPPEVHALVHHINAMLGNVGSTIHYVEEADPERPSHLDALKALAAEMSAGTVDTLLILGGNPVYDAPADFGLGAALAKVKNSVHLSLYENETSRAAAWHLPMAHWLESWGDSRGWDGTLAVTQPLIAPILNGKSAIEVLALILEDQPKKGLELVRRTHQALLPDEKRWRKVVHDGIVENSALPRATPAMKTIAALTFTERELAASANELEIVFAADRKVYDGRFSNNAWLQELPDSISKISWDNAAFFSPRTAKSLGVAEGTLVSLSVGGKTLKLPAMVIPGQADGSVRVSLGYGRTLAGRIGGHKEIADAAVAGFDTYQLRTSALFWFGGGLRASATGEGFLISATQDLHSIDPIGKEGQAQRLPQILREGSLEEFKAKPDFAKHKVHHPPLLSLWEDPVRYDGNKWGMSIDLNRCIGCTACVVACQAENNIPVVGKANVERSREMYWIRIDRYYRGDENDPSIAFQPVTCHQCENAPCEQVCPVGATTHNHEGLNDMVYNRCIGTRYCSNNCPYKVRRFNFFNYHLDKQGITPFNDVSEPAKKLMHMGMNPEVTIRARGVMEKCTYCLQRISKVKIKAKNARRKIQDGEIRTACQETCPTDAIVFGDLNDGQSRVARLQNQPRTYEMLGELNNRPRTTYLARITNPHPELAPAKAPAPGGGHGGDKAPKHG